MKNGYTLKLAIPLIAVILGIAFVYMGYENYGFWNPRRGPLTGFYPALMGLCLVVAGIIGAVKCLKEECPVFETRNWLVPLSVGLLIAGSLVIGLLPALAVYLLVWMRLIQKSPWKTICLVMGTVAVMVYGVFILWLQVPFERGYIITEITRERNPQE